MSTRRANQPATDQLPAQLDYLKLPFIQGNYTSLNTSRSLFNELVAEAHGAVVDATPYTVGRA